VATLLVAGPATEQVAGELLFFKSGKKLSDYPADRPIFAHFGGIDGEEIIVRRRSDSHAIELHCHGGYAAIQTIERAFVERGFFLLSWKNWIVESDEDPFATAALLALADARTERTASILLDQYHGALRRAFEEIEAAKNSGISGQVGNLPHKSEQVGNLPHDEQIEELLERVPLGRHLTKPWRVALIGEPNVGKSSLLNALLGYGRAIVHHTPGTTRDLVIVQTAFEGWPIELCDTAGLRVLHPLEKSETDLIEQEGIELAMGQIAQADLLLLIFDASKPWTAADQAFWEKHPQALVIHNKVDLAASTNDRPGGLFVSAVTGQGIEELPRLIAQRLVPHPPSPGAAVPFTEEQVEKLRGFVS
jgi:tRNA modification GTPase